MFDKNFDFWRKFWFLRKILIFEENFGFWLKFLFLTKILIFDENFDFWRKFWFLARISKLWEKMLRFHFLPVNSAQNSLINGHVVLRSEWSSFWQKFKNQNSKWPIISWVIMAGIGNDFWWNIFRSSTEGPRFMTGWDQFCEA